VIVAFALVRAYRWSLGRRTTALVALSFLASGGRLIGLRLHWGPAMQGLAAFEELVNGIVPPLLALVIGSYYVDAQDRTRRIEHLVAQREVEAQRALADLEHEELRVRRAVSETLHGRIQQRLVFIAARMTTIIPAAEENEAWPAVEELKRLIAEVDDLREEEVRQLSHSVYPTGLDIGLQQAIQLQLSRIPASFAVALTVTPAAADVDDVADPELDPASRLLLVAAVDEGVTNAVKHGGAAKIEVVVDLTDKAPGGPPAGHREGRQRGSGSRGTSVEAIEGEERPSTGQWIVVSVIDDGAAAQIATEITESGLARLRQRLEAHGGGIDLAQVKSGATLRAWIPRPPRGQRDAAAR
jgi:signal transduction histidine kinase